MRSSKSVTRLKRYRSFSVREDSWLCHLWSKLENVVCGVSFVGILTTSIIDLLNSRLLAYYSGPFQADLGIHFQYAFAGGSAGTVLMFGKVWRIT